MSQAFSEGRVVQEPVMRKIVLTLGAAVAFAMFAALA
jgi:hypothetical protein